MFDEYASATYRMEMLKSSNWMPPCQPEWKRRMLAVLQDLGLESLDKYIAKDASVPGVSKEGQPTAEEIEART